MWRWLISQCTTHSDIALLGRLMKLMLFFTAATVEAAKETLSAAERTRTGAKE
jgi:hypothetical protein